MFLLLKHIKGVDHDLFINIFIYSSSGGNSTLMAGRFTPLFHHQAHVCHQG